jgi:filamentous hemagglutinin family protein
MVLQSVVSAICEPGFKRLVCGLYRIKLPALAGIGLSAGAWTCADWTVMPGVAIAQVTPDSSLGTLVNGSALDSCSASTCTITGGTLNGAGSTLLHSFSQFSLGQPFDPPDGTGLPSAVFIDPGVNDIVVRVTGEATSFINGAIRANAGSTANLFLVNPRGIQFGPDAQLDLGGAFIGSTAQEIVFANGIVLPAGEASPANRDLLTVSAPIGLGFLANHASGDITVQGTGHRLTFGSPDNPNDQFVNRLFQQPFPPASGGPPPLPPISELAVQPGAAIALIANGIDLTGGNLTAMGGQIELGSISEGTALLNSDLSVDYRQVSRFADVSLTERSALETSASNPGNIRLRGQDISIGGSSAVLAETLPVMPGDIASLEGGLIDFQANGNVLVSGFTAEPSIPFNPPFHSYLSVDAAPGATSAGGTIRIRSAGLSVEDGGQIGANTFGDGNAGQLQITTDETLSLSGGSFLGPSGLFATTGQLIGRGNSGQITIEAQQVLMTQGAQILTSNVNEGAAGSILINADRVSLIGTGAPLAIPSPDGGFQTVVSPTLLQSDMGERSAGLGGDIVIKADQVLVAEGAEISTGTSGQGQAGNLNISTQALKVSGFSELAGPSSVLTSAGFGSTGNGGALNINANRLQVLNGAQIATSTAGTGKAGDLVVQSESILVSGRTAQGRSGLFANAIGSVGDGGNLLVTANELAVRDGATLSVSNFPSSAASPIPPGQGAAGDLRVNARAIALSDQALLSADTAAGDRGNITLTTDLLSLRRNSQITTNATRSATGGNINIDAAGGFVVAVPSENSDITANAVLGDGGRVDIAAQQVLGIQARPQLTPLSDVTASSEFGIAGETRLETLNTDLRSEVNPLPQSTEVPELAQGCSAAGGDGEAFSRNRTTSQFIQSGRGGIGTSPYGVLNSRESLADVSRPATLTNPHSNGSQSMTEPPSLERPSAEPPSAEPPSMVEAQGWVMNAQGEVTLIAASPEGEADRCLSWQSE